MRRSNRVILLLSSTILAVAMVEASAQERHAYFSQKRADAINEALSTTFAVSPTAFFQWVPERNGRSIRIIRGRPTTGASS